MVIPRLKNSASMNHWEKATCQRHKVLEGSFATWKYKHGAATEVTPVPPNLLIGLGMFVAARALPNILAFGRVQPTNEL